MWWRRLAEVQTEHQNGEERGFKWLERVMFVGARRADLLIYWDFHAQAISKGLQRMVRKRENIQWQQLCGRKCLVDVRGQRRMDRLVRDDRKATITQITTRYNQGLQNTISEHTTRLTLKQMGSSSRRPHRVSLLSDKYRTQRIQFTPARQNWTIEDWKNVACLMSLDFCCDIQMVGSEFGVMNVKAWIHPALSQRFRLVVVV